MKLSSIFNMNVAGIVLLGGAYLISVAAVTQRSATQGSLGEAVGSGVRVVQIMHWQLEPGFRESLQAVIDEYNAQPHVVEAGVEVRQLDVTERVYSQMLNVHAISGTAPDICQRGRSVRLLRGTKVAQFFEPLGDVAEEPNPYNAEAYLPEGMDPDLAEAMASLPWRETFVDGMQAGWDQSLQQYYAVPTTFWGEVKLYYNASLFDEAKDVVREAFSQSEPPAWVRRVCEADPVTGEPPLAPRNAELEAWVSSDDPPDTLGRMLLLCEAVWEIGRRRGDTELTPIAGSSYSDSIFARRYLVPFTAGYTSSLDFDLNTEVNPIETWAGYDHGLWSFEDPAVRAYFECLREICEQFPAGFLGLDREQARRRFIAGRAAMVATGAWDATSIYATAEGQVLKDGEPAPPGTTVTEIDGRRHAGFRFRVSVMDFPLPGPGERWSEHVSYAANSAKANGGAPFMVYKYSPNKPWAIDFLRYLTSYRINGTFTREAGWLPIIDGLEPSDRLRPFRPRVEGLSPGSRLLLDGAGGGVFATRYNGQLLNYLAGTIDYGTFVLEAQAALDDERNGLRRMWFREWQRLSDNMRELEKGVGVQTARSLLLDESEAADAQAKLIRGIRRSVVEHNATPVRRLWSELQPNEPFPDY
ncbi:MAG: ABC transporter substrate-binding protein [Planctomycetota bacterium]